MNRILSFLLCFLFAQAAAQDINAQGLMEPKRLFPRENFAPPIDTVIPPARLGELRSRPTEGRVYMCVSYVGQRWISISGGGALLVDSSIYSTIAQARKIVGDSVVAAHIFNNGVTRDPSNPRVIQLGGALTKSTVIGEGAGVYSTTFRDSLITNDRAFYIQLPSSSTPMRWWAGMGPLRDTTTVVLGWNVGRSLSSLNRSGVFIGSNAGSGATSGLGNAVVGFEAGRDLTTGQVNTFFGYRAGRGMTNGLNHVAIGPSALLSYTSGTSASTNMMAFGTGSLQLVTSGGATTAIGYSSNSNATSSTENTSVGHQVQWQALTTTGNVVVGKDAMREGQVQLYNTILGTRGLVGSANSVNQPTGNVGAGYEVMQNNDGGDYNVMLGFQVGKNLGSVSNKLVIDNFDNTVNPFLYGDFSADSLRVNAYLSVEKVDSSEEAQNTIWITQSGRFMKSAARPRILSGQATLDFPSTASANQSELTVTVTGAAVGDAVSIGAPVGSILANGVYTGYVSAADTVTVVFFNGASGPSLDPASGVFNVRVIK
jgi:hypothetical protein